MRRRLRNHWNFSCSKSRRKTLLNIWLTSFTSIFRLSSNPPVPENYCIPFSYLTNTWKERATLIPTVLSIWSESRFDHQTHGFKRINPAFSVPTIPVIFANMPIIILVVITVIIVDYHIMGYQIITIECQFIENNHMYHWWYSTFISSLCYINL